MTKKIMIPLMIVPMVALSACEGSIAKGVMEAGSEGSSKFTDGIKIDTAESDPGEFDGVTLAGPDNIIFSTGDSFSIRAEGDEDALEQLRYKISDGTIKIGRETDGLWDSSNRDAATIYLSAPALKSAKLAGSGNLNVDQMAEEAAKLSIAGSGNIKVAKMETDNLSAKIAGSGDLSFSGSAKNAKLSIAGSGDVSGKDLKADTVKISIAGSGDVELSSDGSVNASVMGSGDVRIHGNAECKSKTMGSGEITCG